MEQSKATRLTVTATLLLLMPPRVDEGSAEWFFYKGFHLGAQEAMQMAGVAAEVQDGCV